MGVGKKEYGRGQVSDRCVEEKVMRKYKFRRKGGCREPDETH